ncbi:MAG TPA: TetR/AcrR family transcriptional regulator [Stellaceae bacterium]|nr:TetR/AcrR family transcriptional regulator [Stellaceae bacterium]
MLQDRILQIATELFLTQGFAATSIEAVAARSRISKRTFYRRFKDKAALFEAVVRHLVARWTPPVEARLHGAEPLADVLRHAAEQILAIALSPEAIALHRVVMAEAPRFPALAQVMYETGTKEGVARIGRLLDRAAAAGEIAISDARFAAEQFLSMVVAVPQRRALGFGPALAETELRLWAARTVGLFLHGCRAPAEHGGESR